MKKIPAFLLSFFCVIACDRNDDGPKPSRSDSVTPCYELNQGDDEPNSHAGQTSSSILTPIGGTYQRLDKSITQMDMPVYPHFTKTAEGDYLMFYHKGNYNTTTGSSSWAGVSCSYMRSPDGINWTFEKEIFPIGKNVQGHYDNIITRYYAGAHPALLPNGDIIVFASYYGSSDMRHRIKDNGLAYRISHDNGHSWTQEARLNVGTCWEPWPVVLRSGRIVVYYTDSCPYIEGVWSSAIISSGVSYVYSDDNGKTWKPDDLLNDHLWAFRRLRDEKNGTKAYTDQMCGVINLVGSDRQVICAESNYASCSSSTTDYWVDLGYTDNQGNWMPVNADNELPADRVNKAFKGAAPTLDQFVSGETVATYNRSRNGSNFYYYHLGDENARNWGDMTEVFHGESPIGYGFWGSTFCDGHIMLAGVGGSGGKNGTGYPMQVGLFYLNHNITASSHPVKVDGGNNDWLKSDQALFVGSNSPMHATLRCSVSSSTAYFLAEVEGGACAPGDCVTIYLTDPGENGLKLGDLSLTLDCDGNSSSSVFKPGWYKQDVNMEASVSKGKGFYVAEFSVPRSALPEAGGRLKVNFAVNDSGDGLQSIRPVAKPDTSNWIEIIL